MASPLTPDQAAEAIEQMLKDRTEILEDPGFEHVVGNAREVLLETTAEVTRESSSRGHQARQSLEWALRVAKAVVVTEKDVPVIREVLSGCAEVFNGPWGASFHEFEGDRVEKSKSSDRPYKAWRTETLDGIYHSLYRSDDESGFEAQLREWRKRKSVIVALDSFLTHVRYGGGGEVLDRELQKKFSILVREYAPKPSTSQESKPKGKGSQVSHSKAKARERGHAEMAARKKDSNRGRSYATIGKDYKKKK